MHLAMTMLIKFVYINIYGSNTEYSFYILYTQNDIKVLRSTEYSNFSLSAACSDFWIHIGAFPKNNSSLCKWNKAQLILIWSRGRKGIKTSFKWSYCWGISFDLNPPEIPFSNFQKFLRNKSFFLFSDKTQKEKLGESYLSVSVALTTQTDGHQPPSLIAKTDPAHEVGIPCCFCKEICTLK